jgi:arylsulfatase A-like enzyme
MKISRILLLLLVLANFQCRKDSVTNSGEVQGRPNIIFLLADDMRFDALGCTGNPLAITPNLDTLAAQGTNFKNSYVTSAICAISRASILTGQYQRRHGINDFDKNLSDKALQQSYPVLLRQNGYYTGFIGKYGVGTMMPSTYFDYWRGFPGHGVYFYRDSAGNQVHETEFKEIQAEKFLDTRDKSKPFCLSVSFKAPHSEDGVSENNGFRPDHYFNNWYTSIQFPYPATYANQYYFRFPPLWRTSSQNVVNEGRERWNMRFSTPDKFQTTYHAIYRLVSGIDKAVGELRQYLKANGLDKNTIIVFTSDNGYYMGEHGLEGKWYGHEESIRVPLIIYNPRVQQPRSIANEIALNIDLAPTFLEWGEVKTPLRMQGRSLAPLLTRTASDWRTEFFYEHPYDPGPQTYIPKTIGLVSPPWKYMRYYTGNNPFARTLYEELFDLSSDKYEQRNLINNPAQTSRVTTYQKKVASYLQALR